LGLVGGMVSRVEVGHISGLSHACASDRAGCDVSGLAVNRSCYAALIGVGVCPEV